MSREGDLYFIVAGCINPMCRCEHYIYIYHFIEGSLEVKLPTIWTDEKQSREEAERRERLEERRVRRKKSKKKENADA